MDIRNINHDAVVESYSRASKQAREEGKDLRTERARLHDEIEEMENELGFDGYPGENHRVHTPSIFIKPPVSLTDYDKRILKERAEAANQVKEAPKKMTFEERISFYKGGGTYEERLALENGTD